MDPLHLILFAFLAVSPLLVVTIDYVEIVRRRKTRRVERRRTEETGRRGLVRVLIANARWEGLTGA